MVSETFGLLLPAIMSNEAIIISYSDENDKVEHLSQCETRLFNLESYAKWLN